MSERVDCIVKNGTVESVGDKTLKVQIHNNSACSACHSKSMCTSLGSGDRIIEVEFSYEQKVFPGDNVNIQMISSSGWKAVVLGYIIPFILLITTLIIATNFTGEALSAILSLAILIPYYFMLFLFRNKIKKYFRFTLS